METVSNIVLPSCEVLLQPGKKSLLFLGNGRAKECTMNLEVSFGVDFAKAIHNIWCMLFILISHVIDVAWGRVIFPPSHDHLNLLSSSAEQADWEALWQNCP